jgi:lipopolysaccharide transport system permease protein
MRNDLFASRELAWRLLVRNISARYRQTALGFAWAILPPVFTTILFVYLNSQKIISIQDTTLPYPAYVLISTLLWHLFVGAMMSPIKIIKQSKSFISKINFPREALLLAGIGEVIFNFLIRAVLLIIILFWYKIQITPYVLLAPIGILSLLSLGLMFGLFLVPIAILYQDIEKGLPLITTTWLFLTPVVYPIPQSWPASLIVRLNPVTPILVTTRDMITAGDFAMLPIFWMILIINIVLLFIGWIMYRIALPYLIERMAV